MAEIVPPRTARLSGGVAVWRLERELDGVFWDAKLDGPRLITRFGATARGAEVRQVIRVLSSASDAAAAAERAIVAKRSQGFVLVDAATEGGRRLPRHPALERAIWDDPTDLDSWQVFIDWLGESVSSRRVAVAAAELAAVRKGRDPSRAAAPDRAVLLAADLGELDPAGFRYRFGFWASITVPVVPDLDGDEARFLEVVEVLSEPCAFTMPEYEEAIRELTRHPPPGLRLLRLNDTEYPWSWLRLGRLDLFEACPRLEHVDLVGGSLTLGPVVAPRLRTFRFRTTVLSPQLVQALIDGQLPQLEALELWIGASFRSDVRIEHFAALLRRPWPALTALALCNAPFTDALVPLLANSAVLPRLRTLSLAHGTLTATGARALLRRAQAFAHLDRLDLSNNLLDTTSIDAIRWALRNAATGGQRECWDSDEDDDPSYYVEVRE